MLMLQLCNTLYISYIRIQNRVRSVIGGNLSFSLQLLFPQMRHRKPIVTHFMAKVHISSDILFHLFRYLQLGCECYFHRFETPSFLPCFKYKTKILRLVETLTISRENNLFKSLNSNSNL